MELQSLQELATIASPVILILIILVTVKYIILNKKYDAAVKMAGMAVNEVEFKNEVIKALSEENESKPTKADKWDIRELNVSAKLPSAAVFEGVSNEAINARAESEISRVIAKQIVKLDIVDIKAYRDPYQAAPLSFSGSFYYAVKK
jgi:hypothetical protein